MQQEKTIAAIATPPGEGGIAIIRLSGAEAVSILDQIFCPANPQYRRRMPSNLMVYGNIFDTEKSAIDEAMTVVMRAPKSYTREDVVELHCHGGRIIAKRVLNLMIQHGASPASPGEFTRRAFMNGRIDLSQAEAVQQLIGAQSQKASDAALHQMQGGVSARIQALREDIIKLLSAVEACIDFPEEVAEEEAISDLLPKTLHLAETLETAANARHAKVLQEGIRVVIAGQPNVGKSTLLNALLQEDRAIVTDVPGTTRDVLTEGLLLDGILFHLSDTAGLRDSQDEVERIGIERAEQVLSHADIGLILIDASLPWQDAYIELIEKPFAGKRLLVLNKGDLPSVLSESSVQKHLPKYPVLSISAREGIGISQLTDRLVAMAEEVLPADAALTNGRHIEAAQCAARSLRAAASSMEQDLPLDLCAVDLREALHRLGTITGESVDEQVLDEIFASFCVGK